MIALALMTGLFGLFVLLMQNSSAALAFSAERSCLASGAERALHVLEADLRETRADWVSARTFEEQGWDRPQSALAMPSPRDFNGQVHVTEEGWPDWQTIVVYCPYITDAGERQLRRYQYPVGQHQFPLAFRDTPPIHSQVIRLRDTTGPPRSLVVNRRTGHPHAQPRFTVVCSRLVQFAAEDGPLWTISISVGRRTPDGDFVEVERARTVFPRN
jgi:hypothetical protein